MILSILKILYNKHAVTSCKSKHRMKGFYPSSPHHRPFKGGGLDKKFKRNSEVLISHDGVISPYDVGIATFDLIMGLLPKTYRMDLPRTR